LDICNEYPSIFKFTKLKEVIDFLFTEESYYYNFFKKDNLDSTPILTSIWRVAFTVCRWDIDKFKEIDVEIDKDSLKDLKAQILHKIFEWIRNSLNAIFNPRIINSFRNVEAFEKQYQISLGFWLIESALSGEPVHLSIFRSSKREDSNLGLGVYIGKTLTQEKFIKYSGVILRNAYFDLARVDVNSLRSSESPFSAEIIQQMVKDQLSLITDYMKEHKISFLDPKEALRLKGVPTRQNGRPRGWTRPYTFAYNVIVGLGRFLGFDPYFFRPLRDNVFLEGRGSDTSEKFARHEPFRYTLNAFEQILTSGEFHNAWEARVTPGEAEVIINKAIEMINLINDKYRGVIDIDNGIDDVIIDIEKIYKGEEWILRNWKSDEEGSLQWDADFRKNLKDLLCRINKVRVDGLQGFLSHYYKTAYERYYINIVGRYRTQLYWLLHKIHNTAEGLSEAEIFTQALSIDFGNLFEQLFFEEDYGLFDFTK
jgi:hypothetical protein